MTRLATQEQFGRQRFSLDKPTIQSGLGIIYAESFKIVVNLTAHD